MSSMCLKMTDYWLVINPSDQVKTEQALAYMTEDDASHITVRISHIVDPGDAYMIPRTEKEPIHE